ncbi:MAG TPA: molecular chaperone DnaJ [Myxococcales bacterium]|nr:molecular chaperone DnaJ [Myxococcales bacterium]
MAEAERQLRAALDEVNALDAEIDDLSARLESFARAHDEALRGGYHSLELAERLVRKLQWLRDAVARLSAALDAPPLEPPPNQRRAAARAGKKPPAPPPPPEEDGPGEDEAEEDAAPAAALPDAGALDEARALKRLLRRLARVLHPDLAQDEAERARLHHLMSEVNAAYERGDRTALEVMAEKVGAGEPVGAVTAGERLAHLRQRTEALRQAARSLRLERDRLRATDTFRLLEEAERRRKAGADYLAETARELEQEEQEALADAWARLRSVEQAARALGARREQRMKALTRGEKGRRGAPLRAFDPVLESPLVRRGVARLEKRGATAAARHLARELEAALDARPWEVALALLAYFCELAGGPPETLERPDDWRARYDALRARWPEAPSLEQLLARLPAHLDVGLREQGQGALHLGVQLRGAELLPGVSIALEHAPLAALARDVLRLLGPRQRCAGCGEEVELQHVLRTRGLDELHALVCPRCFAVQKRYFLFSHSDGLEALNPQALKLGLLQEQVVKLSGASIAFQLLQGERARLTAADLGRRLHDCYFAAYKVPVPPEALRLYAGGRQGQRELRGMDAIPARPVIARLDRRAGLSEREALELLRSRIERRFRPDSG